MIIPKKLRIPYLPAGEAESEWRAHRDAATFNRWLRRLTTSEQAAIVIARHNECEVTAQQFEANAIMLGYYPRKPRYGMNYGTGYMDSKNGDSEHEVEPMQGYEIHRFFNRGNVPYSAIYVDGFEKYRCERDKELQIIEQYYNTLG